MSGVISDQTVNARAGKGQQDGTSAYIGDVLSGLLQVDSMPLLHMGPPWQSSRTCERPCKCGEQPLWGCTRRAVGEENTCSGFTPLKAQKGVMGVGLQMSISCVRLGFGFY
jgi:hypothetical protein